MSALTTLRRNLAITDAEAETAHRALAYYRAARAAAPKAQRGGSNTSSYEGRTAYDEVVDSISDPDRQRIVLDYVVELDGEGEAEVPRTVTSTPEGG